MSYEIELRSQLSERLKRLLKATYDSFPQEIRYFADFVLSQRMLANLVEEIEASNPEIDPSQWCSEKITYQGYSWPESESGRAKVVWWLIRQWAFAPNSEETALLGMMQYFKSGLGGGESLSDTLRDMTEQTIDPFVGYLQDRINEGDVLLHFLEKYKYRVEWFERDRLFAEFEQNRSHGEDLYDTDLRRFLFEQGVDFPFSKPRGPSGEADVLVSGEKQSPQPLEIKLFDGEGRGVAYVAKGLRQAHQYASDYTNPVGFVIVMNLSDTELRLPTDSETENWPPRLVVGGKTIYLIVIQARPLPTVTQRSSKPISISRKEVLREMASNLDT